MHKKISKRSIIFLGTCILGASTLGYLSGNIYYNYVARKAIKQERIVMKNATVNMLYGEIDMINEGYQIFNNDPEGLRAVGIIDGIGYSINRLEKLTPEELRNYNTINPDRLGIES